MPGIGIITNPNSRRNRRFPEQMRRMGYILGQEDVFELTNRIEDVRAVAEQFRDNEIDILALNGGDGTNSITLTNFIKVYGEDQPLPKFAFLRGGTMNTMADAVGIQGTPSRLLANLVEKYYTGQPFETTQRDTIEIRDENGLHYGFIFGNGIVSNFLEIYYKDGDPNPATAAALLSRAVASVAVNGELAAQITRPFRARVSHNHGQEPWPTQDFSTIMASTVDQIGLGFRPFIRCEEKRHSYHILGLFGKPTDIAKNLLNIRLGLPLPDYIAKSTVAEQTLFESDEPISYTIDGEMHTSHDGRVELNTGPRIEIIIK